MMNDNHQTHDLREEDTVTLSGQDLQRLIDAAVLKAIHDYRQANHTPAPEGHVASAKDVTDTLTAAGLPQSVLQLLEKTVARVRGEYPTDEFGGDEQVSFLVSRAMAFIYESWFRCRIEGAEHVPSEGPVLFVANHGGMLPLDSLMIHHALHHEHALRRNVHCLYDHWLNRIPFLGDIMQKTGHLPATCENGRMLLERGECVCVFPEGLEAQRRLYTRRYRLRRFKRRDLLKMALCAGAPVVPCVVHGAEDAWPLLFRFDWLGAMIGLPFLPVTPQFPGFPTPLSLIPLPIRWRIRFLAPVPVDTCKKTGGITEEAYLDSLGQIIRERMQRTLDAWSGVSGVSPQFRKG